MSQRNNDLGCPALVNIQRSTPYYVTGVPRQKKYNPNKRTDQSSRKKIQLNDGEIVNLSDAEFKTLVVRMLTEMIGYGHKIEEKVKAMKSEIKGTYSEGKETRTQINDLDQKEEGRKK